MDKKIKDLMYAFSANFLNFLMGFVTGFIIPKFLGIDDYAYLKLFTFYITYPVLRKNIAQCVYLCYNEYI